MCSILLAWHFGIYIVGRFDLITLLTTSHRPTVHMCDLLNDRCGLCSMRKCSVCIVVWGPYPKVNQNIQFQHLGQTRGIPNSKENPRMWEEPRKNITSHPQGMRTRMQLGFSSPPVGCMAGGSRAKGTQGGRTDRSEQLEGNKTLCWLRLLNK